MIQWPAPEKLSKVAAGILERVKRTAGAKELEQDAREWRAISWSWLPDPPFSLTFRSADNEERYFVMEGDGRWQTRVIRPASTLGASAP